MKRTIVLGISVLMLLAVTATAFGDVRGPISILGNFDLTAENGIVGGSGTDEDPYVLANWEIVVPEDERYGLRIENVTAALVVRGVNINNAYEPDGAAIRIGYSEGVRLEGCSVANSLNGIELASSTDVVMDGCILYTSGRALRVSGESEDQYRHVVTETTEVNGKRIYYYYGLNGEEISGLTGGNITVAASRNVTIAQNEVTNGDGINLAYVQDSIVRNNLTQRTADVPTEHGLYIDASENIDVQDNIFKNSRAAGIYINASSGCTFTDNWVISNDRGISLAQAVDNVFRDNYLYNNETGMMIVNASHGNLIDGNTIIDDREFMREGVHIDVSWDNTVRGNLITGAEIGIVLDVQAVQNAIEDNTVVRGAGYGLYVSGAENTVTGNLIAQFSRGVLFPETYGNSTTEANRFEGNVFANNVNHLYTNLDSQDNVFTQNIFLEDGSSQVADNGEGNVWTEAGLGNYWANTSLQDADGDGILDGAVTIYPADVDDTAPLALPSVADYGIGVVSTLESIHITIDPRRGKDIEFDVLNATQSAERATGFRGFPEVLAGDVPGILFQMPEETEGNFTMQTVLFDLDIAFFDADGEWVGGTTMNADNGKDETLYAAGAPYLYALELPAGSLEDLGIGSGSTLKLP